MKRYDRRFWLFDAILAVMFLICVALTYRSCAAKPERPMPVAAVPVPTPTPEPTPVPVDPDPERTMMLAAVTFFESIANGRYEEAAELFQDPENAGAGRRTSPGWRVTAIPSRGTRSSGISNGTTANAI
ncbi:MAG: hypothetical protein M5R36_09650 [Deltaproteobacteria bacterium]|nr:hypothetical protein [Deltaproteobacteria bacterium]